MATYNFKRESKVYIVRNGLKYTLEVYPDLSFSQTFEETTVPVKTLHSQYDMFENAVITRANPANFSFTVPLILQGDMDFLFNLLKDYDATSSEAILNTFDLYLESNSEVYKLEYAVMESGIFTLNMAAPITVSLSGSARKLAKHTGTIPGTSVSRSVTRTYTRIDAMDVQIGGVTQPYITSVSVELRNNVQWMDFATLQKSVGISVASGVMTPEAFVVGSRTLSGTVQQYVTNETNSNVNTWSTSAALSIRVGTPGAYTLQINLPSVVYTNRLEVQEVYIQSYDFRMNTNPSVASIITKRTI